MVDLTVKQRVYCKDCIWRWHSFLNDENGQCSHIKNRNSQNWDYPQPKNERYSFCTNVNTSGNCPEFEKKKKWWRKLC